MIRKVFQELELIVDLMSLYRPDSQLCQLNNQKTLHSPHLNVRLGVRYYKELLEHFGDEQIALTAYCFGPSRVSMWLRAGTFAGSRYARDILEHYRQLNDPRV